VDIRRGSYSYLSKDFEFYEEVEKTDSLIIAEDAFGVVQGFVSYVICPDTIELMYIEVKPEYRNRSLAKKMLEKLFHIYGTKRRVKMYLGTALGEQFYRSLPENIKPLVVAIDD